MCSWPGQVGDPGRSTRFLSLIPGRGRQSGPGFPRRPSAGRLLSVWADSASWPGSEREVLGAPAATTCHPPLWLRGAWWPEGPGRCITAWKPAWLPAGGVLAPASVCAGPDRDRAPLPPGGSPPARSLLLPVHVQCCSFSTGGTPARRRRPRYPADSSTARRPERGGLQGLAGKLPRGGPGLGPDGDRPWATGALSRTREPAELRASSAILSRRRGFGGDGFARLRLSDNNLRAFLRSLRGFVENQERAPAGP